MAARKSSLPAAEEEEELAADRVVVAATANLSVASCWRSGRQYLSAMV